MDYKHTQVGYLMLPIFLAVTLFFAWIYKIVYTETGHNFIILGAMIFFLFLISSFLTLQVKVNKEFLRVKFGYGLFRKTIKIKKINSVRTVRNKWYYGWGIRLWLWPRMWIFNVSGFDAVEIKTKNKRIFRIGTDEPEKLKQAISKFISK